MYDAFEKKIMSLTVFISHQPPQDEVLDGEAEEAEEEDLILTLRKFPRTPQPWESFGSEIEVEEENVTENRPKVSL